MVKRKRAHKPKFGAEEKKAFGMSSAAIKKLNARYARYRSKKVYSGETRKGTVYVTAKTKVEAQKKVGKSVRLTLLARFSQLEAPEMYQIIKGRGVGRFKGS